MNSIDTLLFVEIIQTEGAMLLPPQIQIEDDIFEYYHGPSGKRVQICTTEECIDINTACAYLRQLGMSDLIERLFN